MEEFGYLGVLFMSVATLAWEINGRMVAASLVWVSGEEAGLKAEGEKLWLYQPTSVPPLPRGHRLWLVKEGQRWIHAA